MKKIEVVIAALLASCCIMSAQTTTVELKKAEPVKMAVKSNLLYDLTATLNVGVEFPVAPQWSVDVSANINGWCKWKHYMLQPEGRYWLNSVFNGTFVAGHIIAALGNAGGFSTPVYDGWENSRSKGSFYGLGLGVGYAYNFNAKWGLEGELALGYIHFAYDKYDVDTDILIAEDQSKNYFGPTKAALSLVYHF